MAAALARRMTVHTLLVVAVAVAVAAYVGKVGILRNLAAAAVLSSLAWFVPLSIYVCIYF